MATTYHVDHIASVYETVRGGRKRYGCFLSFRGQRTGRTQAAWKTRRGAEKWAEKNGYYVQRDPFLLISTTTADGDEA